MLFNLDHEDEYKKAVVELKRLLNAKCWVELRRKNKVKTVSQRKYLHVCINIFAIHIGQSTYEAKTDIKRAYGLFYEKNGKSI